MIRMTVVIGILIAGITGCATDPCKTYLRDEEEIKVKSGDIGEPISCIKPPEVLTPNDIAP
ncbi:hypothetical protein [Nitrosomonas sp. Nm33]|uniref:hypothetical protein n=1 Tax=Nitrosomonas sp. Nm33 TaxID=133724 RepID=UPI00089B62DA|nr:hypothetical protein [Nitrosomonas sp. Nm33]SDZ10835.1 hypothetical protein SAMN05421755_11157 [Nitrosomonas sp. Nm33]